MRWLIAHPTYDEAMRCKEQLRLLAWPEERAESADASGSAYDVRASGAESAGALGSERLDVLEKGRSLQMFPALRMMSVLRGWSLRMLWACVRLLHNADRRFHSTTEAAVCRPRFGNHLARERVFLQRLV